MSLAGSDLWTERWFHAMGSDVHVLASGGDLPSFDAIGAYLDELEECWSRFRPSSDLSRLNGAEGRRVEVSPLLVAALGRARTAWALTEGRFDPTVHDSLCAAGYDATFPAEPVARGDLAGCRPAPGMSDVVVDAERCLVTRPPGVRFDLGGIGKGLAADLLASRLVEQGVSGVCVGMGGDVRVAGIPPAGGWRIPVEHPHGSDPDRPGPTWFELTMTEGAVVTSTTRFRRWATSSGRPAHHLVDPATGHPTTSGLDAVVVAAGEAWWAEVLAKAALVAGRDDGARLLERYGVTAWFVPEVGRQDAA